MGRSTIFIPGYFKWNVLDDTTVTAKTMNSFKTKLKTEKKTKMGLFLD